MGSGASRTAGGMVVTLDALGTLYRFKEPFPVQYSKLAKQLGLKANFEVSDLEKSFRTAFKKLSEDAPNYGRGILPNPEAWWTALVSESFKPLIGEEPLPSDLGRRLYHHFSSGSAYELFPDVKPFMEIMGHLKKEFSDPMGPMIITGVISNSDPRVRQVLNSLGLRMGPSQPPKSSLADIGDFAGKDATEMVGTGRRLVKTPYHNYYQDQHDFDFLTTSYEADSEKPEERIFRVARATAMPIPFSRAEQALEGSDSLFGNTFGLVKLAYQLRRQVNDMKWIHIGDDLDKDIRGAQAAGHDALWLVRDPKEQKSAEEDLKDLTVTNLEDAGTVINLMAQQQFG